MSDHVEHRLTAYHDRALDSAEAAPIRAHLASCSACCAVDEDLVRFEALLSEAVSVTDPPPAFLWTRVAAQMHRRPAFRMTFRFAGGVALASVVGLALSFAVPTGSSAGFAVVEEDLWTAFDYGLVDGAPAALAALETQVLQ